MGSLPRLLPFAVGASLLAGCVGEVSDFLSLDPTADPARPSACAGAAAKPGPAPLRRLTRNEYDNTVRDLLGDATHPAVAFPAEELGNGFGNDADSQAVSSLLADEYGKVASAVALRATETPAKLALLHSCAGSVTAATEEACTRSLVEDFAARAYRRPVEPAEVDELVALARAARPKATFAISIATVLEAVLQSPDFLYKLEWGVEAGGGKRRPSGSEMATRLSYLYWGTQPDAVLRQAALAGELDTPEGVKAHAARMLADPAARPTVRYFFDNLLPLTLLTDLERDKALFPTFNASMGALMREETQRFLEYEIFEGSGTWTGALTAPYTFVNEPLAQYYGMSGVQGTAFQKAPLDTTKRLGLLTQGGVLAGTTHSNMTSPVVRGAFVAKKLMCRTIPLPTGELLAQVKPPEPYTGKTARERYGAHSAQAVCAGCHAQMDPIGLTLENFDPVGLWRDTENGVTIDASGAVPGTGTVGGPVELVRMLAQTEDTQDCFAYQWMTFAYGRKLGAADACSIETAEAAFKASGGDVKKLLISLTQTDAFLYLPGSTP